MTTPSGFVEQLLELRDAGMLERARQTPAVLAAFRDLGADQKREVAILVAERSAPHLVDRIRAETGQDLTAEQVGAVFDMVRRLDGDDLDAIRDSLDDAESRQQLLREVGGSVAAATATAAGATDVLPAPEFEESAASTGEAPTDDEFDEYDEELTETADDSVSDGAAYEDDASDEEADATIEEALEHEDGLEYDEADDDHADANDVVAADDEAISDDEIAEYEVEFAVEDAALAGAYEQSDLDMVDPATSAYAVGGYDDPRSTLSRPTDAELLIRLGEVADGWRRRRLLDEMVRDGEVQADQLVVTVATLERRFDRAWILGTALDEGLVTGAMLTDMADDLVDPRTLARLSRRTR